MEGGLMVVDTSALLGVIFAESQGREIAELMQRSTAALRMSTVNLAEALILIEDRQPHLADKLHSMILGSNIRFVAPSEHHAKIAAKARITYPLNLGDCFAYALAKSLAAPLLYVGNDFAHTDVETALPSGDRGGASPTT